MEKVVDTAGKVTAPVAQTLAAEAAVAPQVPESQAVGEAPGAAEGQEPPKDQVAQEKEDPIDFDKKGKPLIELPSDRAATSQTVKGPSYADPVVDAFLGEKP